MSVNVGLFNRPASDELSPLSVSASQSTQAGGSGTNQFFYLHEVAVAAKTIMVRHGSVMRSFLCNNATDNRTNVTAALEYARDNLPNVEVLVGAGDIPLDGGVTVTFPDNSKGFSLRGVPGATRFVLTGTQDYATAHGGGAWFAIRLWNTSQDDDPDNYMEDFHVDGIGVYDEAPWLHASSGFGEVGGEETHGINVAYCKRATISNCTVDQVGDEGIEADFCEGLTITNNHTVRCTNQERGGGAQISVKNGCKRFIVANNTVTDGMPPLWVAGTYAQDQRVLGSDDTIYGAKANGTTSDPVVTPADWEDISALATDAPLTYGIGVKVIQSGSLDVDILRVEEGVIANNTINNVVTAGIDIACPGSGARDISVIANSVNGADYGLRKTGGTFKFEESTISNNKFRTIRINGVDLASATERITFNSNTFTDVAGIVYRNDTIDEIDIINDTIVDCAGTIGNHAAGTNIRYDGLKVNGGGDGTNQGVLCNGAGQGIEFNNCRVSSYNSGEEFLRNVDVANNNRIDLDSPSYRSINSVSEACGNTINGGIRRGVAGPLKANNNTITIGFTLGSSTRGAIALDAAGVSNKGSTIIGNTINNSSADGHCIRIQNQNSESANVIYTSNHLGLGSNKSISDLSTASVSDNNVVT